MFGFWEVVAIGLVAVVAVGWVIGQFRRVTVFEYQHALLFRDGRCQRLLEPGAYWTYRPRTTVELIDARPTIETIPGQEVLSSDGVTVKISLLLEYRVVDPKLAVLESADYRGALYARVQRGLRDAVGGTGIEEVLAARADLGQRLATEVAPTASGLGVELLSITVKDIMFPGPLKEAFSQAARARQETQASLERARGEQAALRSLANAARLLDKNPHLFQLRLLQTAAAGGQVVVHLDRSDDASSPGVKTAGEPPTA